MIVKAYGPRPDNFLFLVHEVFETLIAESFNGVRYSYHVPCTECIHGKLDNPCMIPSERIKNAVNQKVPFLQCTENFHTLSITQLRSKKLGLSTPFNSTIF